MARDYKSRCEEEWRTADSPFFVAGLSGAQVVKLAAAGVKTLSELAALSPTKKIDGMGTETVAKLSAQARLQLNAKTSGKHAFELLPTSRGRGFGMLPAPDDGDLFFDMEGDPLTGEGLEYLFGIFGRQIRCQDKSGLLFASLSPVGKRGANGTKVIGRFVR
jgi:predicted RecB family nuclease